MDHDIESINSFIMIYCKNNSDYTSSPVFETKLKSLNWCAPHFKIQGTQVAHLVECILHEGFSPYRECQV